MRRSHWSSSRDLRCPPERAVAARLQGGSAHPLSVANRTSAAHAADAAIVACAINASRRICTSLKSLGKCPRNSLTWHSEVIDGLWARSSHYNVGGRRARSGPLQTLMLDCSLASVAAPVARMSAAYLIDAEAAEAVHDWRQIGRAAGFICGCCCVCSSAIPAAQAPASVQYRGRPCAYVELRLATLR
jgi:hypothetical protein